MTPLASALAVLRRRNRRAGRTPSSSTADRRETSLVVLVLGELWWSIGRAWRPVPLAAGVAVTVGIAVALGPFTPGAVLADSWRIGVAAVVGIMASVTANESLARRAGSDLVAVVRVIVATVTLGVGAAVAVANLLAVLSNGSLTEGAATRIDGSFPIDRPLLVGSALLVAAVLSVAAGSRTRFPGSLLFLGLGLVVGSGGSGWLVVSDADLVQQLAVAALVVILFEGGLTTSVDDLRRGAPAGVALSTIGVAITGATVALGAAAVLDLPGRVALLIGAVVASTDAAAVFEMLRRAPLPDRLASVLKVESGTNDPIAMLLTLTLVQGWDQPVTGWAAASFGALQLLGGLGVGALLGSAGAAVVRRLPGSTEGLVGVLALGLGVFTYGVATHVGASGLLATYVAGIVLATEAPRRRRAFRSFVTTLAGGVEIGLFLLLGLLADLGRLFDVAGTGLVVAVVLLAVARPIAVGAALTPLRFGLRDQLAVGVLGLRGAVPVVLATIVITSGVDGAETVFDVVFTVVVVATLVQSGIAPWLLGRLGLEPDRRSADRVEALVADEAGVDLIEADVGQESALAGVRIADAGVPEGVLIGVVVRHGETLIASGSTRLAAGDRLILVRTAKADDLGAIEAWVGGRSIHADRAEPTG